MFFSRKQNSDLDKFADMLEVGTIKLFNDKGVVFSDKPKKIKQHIIESDGRMRADGMEQFDNEPTYVSAVNFYATEKDMEKKNTLGALVVYVQQEYIVKLMKLLQYPPVDDENEEALLDSCGTLCNIIAGSFKSAISSAGYIELEWSHFYNYRNNAFRGIEFCITEYNAYLMEFQIDKVKRIVLQMTMGTVPR